MKTAIGKLMAFALILMLSVVLFAPMREGVEDRIAFSLDSLTMSSGQRAELPYELQATTAQTVSFASDDPIVAQVDQGGVVTALSPGTASIRVTAQNGAYDEMRITVNGVPVTSISLNTDLLELDKGQVSGLILQMNAGADPEEATWISRNESVAQVDQDGRVIAVGGGETDIIVTTSSDLAASAHVKVGVPAEQVFITPDTLDVGVGSQVDMRVRFLPEDATDTPQVWMSSAPDVVSIDNAGRMRARSTGTAILSVTTAQGLVSSAEVIVEPAMSDLALNFNEITLERGETALLEASFLDDMGQQEKDIQHHIEWETSAPSVANIEDGRVRALSTGMAVISASADGFRTTCTVRVQTNVKNVTLDQHEIYLLREQTNEPIRLHTEVIPADADDTSIEYASDNDLVASVDAQGVVTLTGGYGTAVITAKAVNGVSDTFTVNVVVELPEL